jgi:hypothetical protein
MVPRPRKHCRRSIGRLIPSPPFMSRYKHGIQTDIDRHTNRYRQTYRSIQKQDIQTDTNRHTNKYRQTYRQI